MLHSIAEQRQKRELPPLFWYMELGEWEKASDRVRRHPREVKTWATLRTKNNTDEPAPLPSSASIASYATKASSSSGTKRLALHHACFKLRTAGSCPVASKASEDPYVQVCRFILMLLRLYPEAAGQRESRHGCLPLHLACFASCAPRADDDTLHNNSNHSRNATSPSAIAKAPVARPNMIARRIASDATSATTDTNLSAVHAEETYTGNMADKQIRRDHTVHVDPNVSVSTKKHLLISSKREEMAVQVLNALLDAYPKAIRTDSEGGRLPLHTACAGRATPRVIATLVTAYPSAARHRNKDGFLPLHLTAHWGVAHPNVVVTLLKAYPDATVGRNRWERTPLEEALCMAGENGRPHQAAMVRALRKHPSYWQRATAEIIQGTRRLRQPGSNVVDVDESLPSNDSTSLEEQRQGHFAHGHNPLVDQVEQEHSIKPAGKLSPEAAKKKPMDHKLDELIRQHDWDAVIRRVETNPLEVETELAVMTRGGFLSCSGVTPLYYACERQPPVAVVQALIHAHPLAVLTRAMPGGSLPLHVACTWHASPDIIWALLAADQGAAKVTDELGNVALHSALFSGADVRVIQALVQADPEAVLSRNHQGSRPADIGKRLRHENRKLVLPVLQTTKAHLLASHRRSRSSGTLEDIAQQAEELNQRQGTPLGTPQSLHRLAKDFPKEGDPNLHADEAQAIEVSYGAQEKKELMWV
jgi:ankyrin repeat protein